MPTKKISCVTYLYILGLEVSLTENTHSSSSLGDKLSSKLISCREKISKKRDKFLSLEKLSAGIWIYLFMSTSQLPVKEMLKCKEVIKLTVWCQITDAFSHSKKGLSLCCLFTFDYVSYSFHQLKPIPNLLFEPQKENETDGKHLETRHHLGKNRTQKPKQLSSHFSFKLKTFSLQRTQIFASEINVIWPWTGWAALCCCFSFLSAVTVCTVCVQSLAFNYLLLLISFVNK